MLYLVAQAPTFLAYGAGWLSLYVMGHCIFPQGYSKITHIATVMFLLFKDFINNNFVNLHKKYFKIFTKVLNL